MTRDLRQDDPRAILHPYAAPYDCGRLDVGDGHSLYWESCGRRGARPAVFLHGGPGGGCSPDNRRLFDPSGFDVLLFDQRGCGRSLPNASIRANTTQHLIDDIEKLRKLRGVDSWILVGGSWGSALALAYAMQHRDHVAGLMLRGVFTARQSELDWLYRDGASRLFPEAWDAFRRLAPEGDPIAAYHQRLLSPDAATREAAARAWCGWESACMTLLPRRLAAGAAAPTPDVSASATPTLAPASVAPGDRDKLYALALIETHYFLNGAFLEEGALLRDAGRLSGLPGVLVQGRYDCVTPPRTAWDLHRAWPGSRLDIAPDAGHASSEPGIARRLVAALDAFAKA